MNRDCCVCRATPELLNQTIWHLPGLGAHPIGFSICPACGFVLQSPLLSAEELHRYYAETAIYQTAGSAARPAERKVKGVQRQIEAVIQTLGHLPSSAFQVGCSDGYTLSSFQKAGVKTVNGIDPSVYNHQIASTVYGVPTIQGIFEELASDEYYELMILSHVLEHLHDPEQTLTKASSMQQTGDWLLVEVPLLEQIDRCPTGYFSFEHLNYFSEQTLSRLITAAGYRISLVSKFYNVDIYPVIFVLAQKAQGDVISVPSDYVRAKNMVTNYFVREKEHWKQLEQRVKQGLEAGAPLYLWGAGIHSSQLLANTDLGEFFEISGLFDSSPNKWGKQIGAYNCFSADQVELKAGDTILISSYASESQIYVQLQKKYAGTGVNIRKLYGEER